jgi:hypothetical protein
MTKHLFVQQVQKPRLKWQPAEQVQQQISGFIDRFKGKIYTTSASPDQFGSGAAISYGGGQLNSTGSCSTAGGTKLSTAGTSETTLMSFSLPPKSLDRVGRNVVATAYGTFSTFNTGAKTAKLYFGASAVSVQNSTTVTALQSWWLQLDIFQASTGSTSGTQTIISQQILSSAHGGCSVSTGAEDVTALSTFKITGISSSPTAASPGDVTVLGFQVAGMN